MNVIYRIIFAFRYVGSKWFTRISICRGVVGSPVVLDELRKEWIRAGREVWRVGEGQDVLVLSDRKPLYLAEVRVLELLLQLAQEVLTPSLVVREGHAEAFDRTILVDPSRTSSAWAWPSSTSLGALVFQENSLAGGLLDL